MNKIIILLLIYLPCKAQTMKADSVKFNAGGLFHPVTIQASTNKYLGLYTATRKGDTIFLPDRVYTAGHIDSIRNVEDSLLELLNECRSGKIKAEYINANKFKEFAKKAIQMTNSTPIKKPE